MIIYFEALILLNLLFNFLILLLVQLITRHHTNKWRLFFGACFATLIVPVTIYHPESFLTSVFGKIIFSILIILCSFKVLNFMQFTKLFFSFYFMTFSLGGGLIALHFLMNESFLVNVHGFLTYETGFGDLINWTFVLFSFPFVWFFTKFRMDRHKDEQIIYDEIYSVSIEMKGKQFKTNGFIDSGNQLIDPLTNTPVVICDEIFLQQFFNVTEWKQLKLAANELDVDSIPATWKNRTLIVPFKGVSGSDHILLTLKPDLFVIYYGHKRIETKNVLIGIQFSNLTNDYKYHCLLHPKIVQTAS